MWLKFVFNAVYYTIEWTSILCLGILLSMDIQILDTVMNIFVHVSLYTCTYVSYSTLSDIYIGIELQDHKVEYTDFRLQYTMPSCLPMPNQKWLSQFELPTQELRDSIAYHSLPHLLLSYLFLPFCWVVVVYYHRIFFALLWPQMRFIMFSDVYWPFGFLPL